MSAEQTSAFHIPPSPENIDQLGASQAGDRCVEPHPRLVSLSDLPGESEQFNLFEALPDSYDEPETVEQLELDVQQPDDPDQMEIPVCTQAWTKATCPDGHSTYLPQRCNREWCPDCGANTHDDDEMGYLQSQRFKRTIDRARLLYEAFPNLSPNKGQDSIGQYVVTFSDRIQGEILNRQIKEGDALTEIRRAVWRALKSEGYSSAIPAFHVQGDDGGHLWRPHLHTLVNDGFIKEDDLRRVKKRIQMEVAKTVREWSTTEVWSWQIIVNYNYQTEENKVGHMTRYLIRPTATNRRDDQEAIEFYRYIWGRKEYKDDPPRTGPLKNTTLMVPLGDVRSINLTTSTEISCPACEKPLIEFSFLSYFDGHGEIFYQIKRGEVFFVGSTRK